MSSIHIPGVGRIDPSAAQPVPQGHTVMTKEQFRAIYRDEVALKVLEALFQGGAKLSSDPAGLSDAVYDLADEMVARSRAGKRD